MRALLVYLPYIIAISYQNTPIQSYWIAWGGSLFILFITIFGIAAERPKDLGLAEQLFRPHIFTQLQFTGYNCLTTIFYYAELDGYFFFERVGQDISINDAHQIATCQCYYVLAHAAFAHGMIVLLPKYNTIKHKQTIKITTEKLIKVLFAIFGLYYLAISIGLFSAMQAIFLQLLYLGSALLVSISLKENKYVLLSIGMYLFMIGFGLLTGFKTPVLIAFISLMINLFVRYKLVTICLAILFIYIMPFFTLLTTNIRKTMWYEGGTFSEAVEISVKQAKEGRLESEAEENMQWKLLTLRTTEVSAFILYTCLLYTSPSPRDRQKSRMPSSA